MKVLLHYLNEKFIDCIEKLLNSFYKFETIACIESVPPHAGLNNGVLVMVFTSFPAYYSGQGSPTHKISRSPLSLFFFGRQHAIVSLRTSTMVCTVKTSQHVVLRHTSAWLRKHTLVLHQTGVEISRKLVDSFIHLH